MNKFVFGFFVSGIFVVSTALFAQQQIFVTTSDTELYTINVENCTRQLVGTTGLSFGDIAFTSNDRLWGIESGKLYEINTSDATVAFVGNTGIYPVSLVGINDTLLFAEDQMNLYSINTNNASINYIGFIGYSADGDLVWDGATLFMMTPLVKIELNNELNQIDKVTLISNTIPYTEGAIIYGDELYSLAGFHGADLYEICQLDGSFNLLCPNLNIGGTPGAASTYNYFEPVDMVNVITPNLDGINDYFQPVSDFDKIVSVTILNRWGNTVINLDYPFIWDGKNSSGTEVVEGVYFYTIKLSEECSTENIKHNLIHIIR